MERQDNPESVYIRGHFSDLIKAGFRPDVREPASRLPEIRPGATRTFETGFIAALNAEKVALSR